VLSEGIEEDKISAELSLDMRYHGQSFELRIPFNDNYIDQFHAIHQDKYGYANSGGEIEIVNLRITLTGKVNKPELPKFSKLTKDSSFVKLFDKKVLFPEGKLITAFFSGESLLPGNEIIGPAVILCSDTTILIPTQDTAKVDEYLNLIITIGEI
jgi:N-methylhydantoinase A